MKNVNNQPSLLSVVVPVRNADHHIDEALQSLLEQTEWFCQVIVVDNGRTDRTQGRLVWYAHQERQFRAQVWQYLHACRVRRITSLFSELLFLLKHFNHVPRAGLFRAMTTSCVHARIRQNRLQFV